MTRKKQADRSAPPLPKGESYDRPTTPYRLCLDCIHYLTEDKAYEFHTRQGHKVTNADWYEEGKRIASVVDGKDKPA